MAVRPIDAMELKQRMCALCNQDYSDEPCEPSDCVFVRAINEAPTLTPPNEPLTLEELEGFVEPTPVWWDWACGWVLARKGMIVTWDWRYHNVKELKLKGNFYRRPPVGEEDT